MGADQIAVFRPGIEEVRTQIDEDFCVTFEVEGASHLWVQVTRDSLNIHYPFDDDPTDDRVTSRLELGEGMTYACHEPNKYATWSIDETPSSSELAQLVDRIFTALLECDEDYDINTEIISL
ncbi:MAG: hypothetical protein AAF085_09050 [Planctomycetota bacterium]